MSFKLNAWQGFLAVLLILGVIGGALQLAATELQQNLNLTTWMGSYQGPFIAFLSNSWLIIIVTFIYNIFMYVRQNQLAALKQTTEMFQLEKFVATLAWFIGILGPMAALVSDKQLQGIISFIIVILTAVMQEAKNIYSNQTILPPTTQTPQQPLPTPTPSPAPTPPATPSIKITYGEWAFTPSIFSGQPGAYMRLVYRNGVLIGQETSLTDPRTDPNAVITSTVPPS